MNSRYTYFFVLCLIILSSCFKEEKRLEPHVSGNILQSTIPMEADYKNQVFFDLESNTLVSKNIKSDWDLGFITQDSSYQIILNTAKFMKAANTNSESFDEIRSDKTYSYFFDPSHGQLDSTAIGAWGKFENNKYSGNKKVYIIDRGLSLTGKRLGYKKVVFDSIANKTFYFHHANLNGNLLAQSKIEKNDSFNMVCFSFDQPEQTLKIEPPKNLWDLQFTQYTTMLYTDLGEEYPYLVTGVLLNRNGVTACADSNSVFDEINFNYAQNKELSHQMDIIGYNWKAYDFDSQTYTVKDSFNYIIRDTEGFLFRLRFIGFNNEQGLKGYPRIEFQKL